MAPVTAPGITKPVNTVPVLLITNALTPPMLKAVGVAKLVPFMVTKVPIAPLAGENDVMAGPWANTLTANEIITKNKNSFLEVFLFEGVAGKLSFIII